MQGIRPRTVYPYENFGHRLYGGSCCRPDCRSCSTVRQPKKTDKRISLLIDIQNNIKAQQSAGFKHWATIENLKQAAKTMNFITEHGISSYGELAQRCDAAIAATFRVRADLRATEQKISDLSLLAKHTATYRKLKPTYDRYKSAGDKEKFLRGFESEIILFEASARALKEMRIGKLPSAERLKTEMDELAAWKTALQAEHGKVQKEEREYDTFRQNVDALLAKPKEQERE